ncbi:MAG: hypothetical protein KatS3mg060_3748 [Dehalococcoidia bacterium]|nr:MAG: hypothetical protein KatS3mg060_3748 [Dehalococcoidia bacterium]
MLDWAPRPEVGADAVSSLACQLVGSYSKPHWLFARERYPFHREEDAWRPAPELLQSAQDDATLLAIYDPARGRA